MHNSDHQADRGPASLQREVDALWKARCRAYGLIWAEVAARAPARGLAISMVSGTAQLYAWDVETGSLQQRTSQHEGVFNGTTSPDGRYLYFVRDSGGSETGHYVRVPWDGGEEQDLTPDMTPYAALYRCAINDAGTMFAFTPTEAQGFPLYCLDLGADGTVGPARELYRSPKLIDDVALTPDGALAVIATTEHAQARQYSLAVIATAGVRQVATLSDLPAGSLRAAMFSPLQGDRRLLCLADRSGYNRPLLWNVESGERADLVLDGLEGDIEPLDWSADGQRILLKQTHRASQQLYVYDLKTAALTALDDIGGSYLSGQFAGEQIVSLWSDSTHLPQVVAFDSTTGAWRGTILAVGEALPARPFSSVSFRSSDGVEIQGWLSVPEGDGPFPTILSVHGGPHMAQEATYDPDAQAWLDHGYAYLTINYRGSTTFGRKFKEQIWGDLGHWEVEDMVAAREWLIASGIARPDAILVTGASYGGYLTLMALGKRPELWAGGMALVAPADLRTEFDEGTDWSRGYLTAMMGGTPEEKPEQYVASSPITYAEQITAPLLVIQGRNDLRCPPRQMEQYEAKMKALGKSFEIYWFDAGHGAASTDEYIDFLERCLVFADHIVRQKGDRADPA